MARALVVDARVLYGSGIGRYVRELVPLLAQSGAFSDVVLVGNPAELHRFAQYSVQGAGVLPLPYGRYDVRAQIGWLGLRHKLPSGQRVIWYPHFDAPVVEMPSPAVVTIHDLIPLMHRDTAGAMRRALMRVAVERVTAQARRVIAVSHETAQVVAERHPSVASKMRVVTNGGAEMAAVSPSALPAIVRAPFLLCVANRKPHKNLVQAVEVLAALAPSDPALMLVVAGERYAAWERVKRRARELGVDGRICDVGVVTDGELRALYGACAAFLAPSLAEGFGLPVVEAMACGAPVVAADLPWARAVGGDAVAYAHPMRTDEWVRALTPLLSEGAVRTEAMARGQARAAQFTWEQSARATLAVLCEAADE